MPRISFLLFSIVALVCSALLPGQEPAASVRPQTARQALVEIITKGGPSLQKHLTIEVQEALKSGRAAAALAMLAAFKPESGLQAFETGDVLFAYEEPSQHSRYEVHVDNDDLAGDRDSLELSIHLVQDGKEQPQPFGLMSAHFTVSLKLQQNIWRVDRIAVGTELPIGDPEFFTRSLGNAAGMGAETGGASVAVAGLHMTRDPGDSSSPLTPPEQVVRSLGSAEILFAQAHPDIGFSCSLSELSDASRALQIDPQVNNGIYNGYKFSLAGCQGKPAGSFQILAEPALSTPKGKAYCIDATQNLRVSDDGHGATCVAAGTAVNPAASSEGNMGFYTPLVSAPSNQNHF